MAHLILDSTYYVVKNSKDVKINLEAIDNFVEKIEIKLPDWDKNLHYYSDDKEKVLNYLLLIDCNNFCFWGPKKEGYFILAEELKNFFEKEPQNANLNYFAKLNFDDFRKVFPSLTKFQLAQKRWLITKKVSKYIVENYKGEFYNFVKSAKNSAKKLIEKIYKELYSFDDITKFKNKKIYLLKRAQHLTANIWGAFDSKDIGNFYDMDYLTAFSDYKLPQILYHYCILEYSPFLVKKIKNKNNIRKNSVLELEIRANTIWAVEFLKQRLKEKGINIYSFQIDWFLWNLSHKIKLKLPHHRTITHFY
jgi:hypothetical protein